MFYILNVSVDWTKTIFFVIGGLGIFLYGIDIMGDSLKLLAGNKLKVLIEKTTNTPLKGIFVGIIVTGLLQTSSGTTALTVGLVRAGLMTLPQAVGIILGANIGTTVTSFLIGLQIKNYALPIIGIGSLLIFFMKQKKGKRIGGAMLGFGMIFYGLDLMGSALKVFVEFASFEQAILRVSEIPILGVLVGALLTALVQSSTATIGILQELYTTGKVPLIGAIAIVLGSNIGTTITAILASFGGSIAAKRTATAHVLFNVVGSLLFLAIIYPYSIFIEWLQLIFLDGEPVAMTISFAHIFFNVFNTFVMFFFIKYLVLISKKIIPGEDVMEGINVNTLQDNLIGESPALALESAKQVILTMAGFVKTMYEEAVKFSFEFDKKLIEEGRQYEEIVDTIDQKVHDFLVKVSLTDLDKNLAHLQAVYVDAIRDLERIADHCQNLFDFFEYRFENKFVMSEEAYHDLEHVYEVVDETLDLTIEAFKNHDKVKAEQVLEYEDMIDTLVRKYRKRHVVRVNECTTPDCDDELFVDILSNIERIGDHCTNIVLNVLHENYYHDIEVKPKSNLKYSK
ncbi:MAG: Na/Pi cotransporter family protein [Candidatus Izemoplasmataceae bacterium]|uniref:Na/Pi cotransporter family protein n=1 Tax=Liberiplasma polymorphum TaxID=3374570 RepID=UPI003771AD43